MRHRLKIVTENVGERDDWFFAHATAGGVWYGAYMTSRHGAFMDVLRRMTNAGNLKW